MEYTLKTTPDMIKYIRLQRTGYGNNENIESCYVKNVQRDYDNIQKFLPVECSNILDIGCGLGGIDLLLSQHYKGLPNLNLFDYTQTDKKIHYGYAEQASVYNDLDLTAQFLKMNGVEQDKIHTHNVLDGFPKQKYEIIISLLSCGFHYPVTTYIQEIVNCRNGIVILDIRKGSDQMIELKKHFNSIVVMTEYSKHERVLVR